MSKYLLPCECGKNNQVDVSQAGQQIRCECGQLVEVPTLRGVRELERSDEPITESRKSTEWDATRGMIFAGSLLLFVIGAATSYFGYDGLRKTPNIPREVEQEEFATAVDDLSIVEAYELWKTVQESGLGPRGNNVYVNIRAFRSRRQRILTTGIVLCVVGLIGTVVASVGLRRKAA